MRPIRAKIKKIIPKRSSVPYFRVQMKDVDTGEFYQTDIVPSFRNFSKWRGKLEEGNVLDGMRLKSPGKIDADGGCYLHSKSPAPPKQETLF